ncbi:MAG: hypothetical protein NWP91_03215, partial [Rickettsiaceae bacterium]|nr:hypothetical protein [Rickettsiaceae bacterium]MDP5020727.1 hypothetical protein [Rickettsiaceae bacterium]
MNKKLLLTTVLSSAIISSEIAQAAVLDLVYNGNNDFTFQANHYNFSTLEQFTKNQITTGAINPKQDNIKLNTATQRLLLDDLLKGGELQTQFITIAKADAASEGVNP